MVPRERGAVLAEFAFVLPLLVMLLVGIVEMGIAFNRAQAVEAAAREGARLGSLSSTDTAAITTRVNDSLAGISMSSAPVVTVTPATAKPCLNNATQQVTVKVVAKHTINIPLVPGFPKTVDLTGQAVFRCEA